MQKICCYDKYIRVALSKLQGEYGSHWASKAKYGLRIR